MAEFEIVKREKSDLVARYQERRAAGKELSHKLIKMLNGEDLDSGARDLGLMEGGQIIFDTEDQMAVLMDYCLFNVRRDGMTAVERYSPNESAHAKEAPMLEAMRRSRYSIVKAESTENGGLWVLDVVRNEELFLMDLNFAASAVPGMMLASRLIQVDDFWITGGAALPVTGDAAKALYTSVADWIDGIGGKWDEVSAEKETEFTRMVINGCLHEKQSSEIMYADVGDAPGARKMRLQHGAKVGRNEPCPCRSGKKYKKCCGRAG